MREKNRLSKELTDAMSCPATPGLTAGRRRRWRWGGTTTTATSGARVCMRCLTDAATVECRCCILVRLIRTAVRRTMVLQSTGRLVGGLLTTAWALGVRASSQLICDWPPLVVEDPVQTSRCFIPLPQSVTVTVVSPWLSDNDSRLLTALLAGIFHSEILPQIWQINDFADIVLAAVTSKGQRISICARSARNIVPTAAIVSCCRAGRRIVRISVESDRNAICDGARINSAE